MVHADFRNMIRSEFSERSKRNPKYSQRALARDLSISSGFLSQILNGSRTLSEEKAFSFAKRFRWTETKTEIFLKLLKMNQSKDLSLKAKIYQDLGGDLDFVDLEVEKFEVISNWVHFAILELTKIKGFRSEPAWIARRLGEKKVDIEMAIERLLRLGLLAKNGAKLKLVKNSSVPDASSQAIRQFHKSHLEKAILAIENQPVENRHISGITMAINPKKMPEALELVKQFRRKLMKTMEAGECTKVYQLSVQLFQLDREETP